MTLENLNNLVKIKQLKKEPPDQKEFNNLVTSAKRLLQDAQVEALSEESRFLLAYGAAHALATAALRWHGYRSDNRYLVFQCTQHTVGLDKGKWLVLDKCHKQRNLAEYEGEMDINSQLMKELIEITAELLTMVEAMGSLKS